jgi:hypothetical protein
VIDREDPKDAIKNALIAGVGAKFLGPAIQGSKWGQAATSAMGGVGLGTQAGIAALQSSAAPSALGASTVANAAAPAVKEIATANLVASGAKNAAGSGIMKKLAGGNPLMMYAGLSALGAAENLANPKGGFSIDQYFNKHTGESYSTAEERDEAERRWRELQNQRYGKTYELANGGYIQGPGTGRSDSIPAQIYQDGRPVNEARLSDGEFVMTERAVLGAGNGDRNKGAAKMYAMMRDFERGSA